MTDTLVDTQKLRVAREHMRKGIALINEVLGVGRGSACVNVPSELIGPEQLQDVRESGSRRIPKIGRIESGPTP